jgi:hypothetical protein
MIAIIYETINGKILRNVEMPDDYISYQVGEGESFLEVSKLIHDGECYVKDGILTVRDIQKTSLNKLIIDADGIDELLLSNVPSGVIKINNDTTNDAISGAIENTDTFSTTIPGTYKIKIESFPYLDFEATIEAI